MKPTAILVINLLMLLATLILTLIPGEGLDAWRWTSAALTLAAFI